MAINPCNVALSLGSVWSMTHHVKYIIMYLSTSLKQGSALVHTRECIVETYDTTISCRHPLHKPDFLSGRPCVKRSDINHTLFNSLTTDASILSEAGAYLCSKQTPYFCEKHLDF